MVFAELSASVSAAFSGHWCSSSVDPSSELCIEQEPKLRPLSCDTASELEPIVSPLPLLAGEREAATVEEAAPRPLGAPQPDVVKMSTGNLSCASQSTTDSSGGVDFSRASSPMSRRTIDPCVDDPLTVVACAPAPPRSASFDMDLSEMSETAPPAEEPLVAGRLEVHFHDIAKAMLAADDRSPLTIFLKGVLRCEGLTGEQWSREVVTEPGVSLFLRHCRYQLPLPDDIPDVALRVLKLKGSVQSSTTSRLEVSADGITLHEVSRTHGLLYSERMHVMNTYRFEADAMGGVAWRSWTRTVWTKALPWTHGFLVKLIEGRVRAEAASMTPGLARGLETAARELAAASR
mmetsp:Transcript_61325/g.176453  ORF Transcript_61325/g.176453 Transcript_61325/m.176453 type:complete len:348 (+) Transcript_61325:79-1122(+)